MPDKQIIEVEQVLDELVAQAKEAFGDNLVSVILFGSAVEQRLRSASDVNLLFLLERFFPTEVDAFREPLRAASVAISAKAMFLLREELDVAAELFALKFSDIVARHRILYGINPLAELVIDDVELRRRLREVLLNLTLRLRERYVLLSLREEKLLPVIAETAGPLRAAAAALLKLQGKGVVVPRDALEQFATSSGDTGYIEAVANLSRAREEEFLPAGVMTNTLLSLINLSSYLREQLGAGQ